MRLWILMLLIAAGCTEATPDAAEREQALAAPANDQMSLANQLERDAKSQWTGEVAPAAVDWAEASGHAKVALGALTQTQIDAISASTVPVLLPNLPAAISSAFVTTGDLWYGADMTVDGAHLFIFGSRGEFPNQLKLSAEEEARLSNFTVYRTHQIVTLSFVMYGAAYRLDVECDKPMDDPRCTHDDYVLGLAEGLVLAGGHP